MGKGVGAPLRREAPHVPEEDQACSQLVSAWPSVMVACGIRGLGQDMGFIACLLEAARTCKVRWLYERACAACDGKPCGVRTVASALPPMRFAACLLPNGTFSPLMFRSLCAIFEGVSGRHAHRGLSRPWATPLGSSQKQQRAPCHFGQARSRQTSRRHTRHPPTTTPLRADKTDQCQRLAGRRDIRCALGLRPLHRRKSVGIGHAEGFGPWHLGSKLQGQSR